MKKKRYLAYRLRDSALFVIRFYDDCMKFQDYQRPMIFHQAAPMVR